VCNISCKLLVYEIFHEVCIFVFSIYFSISFRYLGMTVTNQNLIQERINRRLNSGNACYHSIQNLLSSCLLKKNVKIKICKTIILYVVLYVCDIWYVILREQHRLRVFTGCWGKYLDWSGIKWWEGGGKCIMMSCVICTLSQVYLEWSSRGGWVRWGM
jgi:hypothetical protein